jgi:hypothetical protein
VVADDADDGVADLSKAAEGGTGVLAEVFALGRSVAGIGVVGQAQERAQYVDAGLAEVAGAGVVGEPGQGVDAAELDCGGGGAELGDGGGEPVGALPLLGQFMRAALSFLRCLDSFDGGLGRAADCSARAPYACSRSPCGLALRGLDGAPAAAFCPAGSNGYRPPPNWPSPATSAWPASVPTSGSGFR